MASEKTIALRNVTGTANWKVTGPAYGKCQARRRKQAARPMNERYQAGLRKILFKKPEKLNALDQAIVDGFPGQEQA